MAGEPTNRVNAMHQILKINELTDNEADRRIIIFLSAFLLKQSEKTKSRIFDRSEIFLRNLRYKSFKIESALEILILTYVFMAIKQNKITKD